MLASLRLSFLPKICLSRQQVYGVNDRLSCSIVRQVNVFLRFLDVLIYPRSAITSDEIQRDRCVSEKVQKIYLR